MYELYLIDAKTRKETLIERVENWDDVEYIWTEGNYSCDCSRYHFFYPEDKDWENQPCGDIRFALLVKKNGNVCYEEIIETGWIRKSGEVYEWKNAQ